MSSNPLGQLSILKPVLKWIIDIEDFNSKPKSEAIDSPMFLINNVIKDMRVSLYPKGDRNSKIGNIGIFLWNDSNSDVTLDFGFSLLNDNNEKVNKKDTKNEKIKSKSSLGWPDFVSENYVFDPANKLINGGKITIIFDFHNHGTSVQVNKNKNDLKTMNEKLFTNKTFSDVTVKSNGKEFQLHKCILAANSSVFEAMLQADMIEKDKNIIEIDDFDPEVLHQFFKYLYTKTVDNEIKDIVKDLINAAEKYLVTDLKEKCEETMSYNIKMENAIEYFMIADLYNAEKLKRKAMNFIVLNLAKFKNSSELDKLSKVQLLEIIKS